MQRKIILGITGSIAAYKSIDLAKLLLSAGFDVIIVLTEFAESFISAMTWRALFPNRVYTCDATLQSDKMLHITLAKDVDLVLIAPASANFIAKLANGFANCLLSLICLVARAKIMLVPAMNTNMWGNLIVQNNISILLNHSVKIVGPEFGSQACGDIGIGRLSEVDTILHYCILETRDQLLSDKSIVITSGPTREKLDPIRFISNYSSGKMGYALALSSFYAGAKVSLISGPTYINCPSFLNVTYVESSEKMLEISLLESRNADIFIGCAAVSDYKPLNYSKHKIKKLTGKSAMNLGLSVNPDIISEVKMAFPNLFCVAFAAETNDIIKNGHEKLVNKNVDMIAINDVSENKVFGEDFNELQVITKDKIIHNIRRANKNMIADKLLEIVMQYL